MAHALAAVRPDASSIILHLSGLIPVNWLESRQCFAVFLRISFGK